MNARLRPLFANPRLQHRMVSLAIAEMVIIYGASWAAFVYRHHTFDLPGTYESFSLMVAAFYVLYAATSRLYVSHAVLKPILDFPKVISALLAPMCILLAFLFFNKMSGEYSRTWILVWFTFAAAGICLNRMIFSWWMRRELRRGRWLHRLAILGTDAQAISTIEHIHELAHPELRLSGVYDMDDSNVPADLKKSGLYRGDMNQMLRDAQRGVFDAAIISHALLDNSKYAEKVLQQTASLAMNTYYCLPPKLTGRGVAVHGILPEVPMVKLFRVPLEGADVMAKRIMDVGFSAVALLLLSPLFAVVAAAIKMASPGPVFFRQKRNGFRGEDFQMLKFRSMVQGADKMLDENGKEMQAQSNDSRVTWIGKILRRTSVDELPQLINVLKGDMSLVGPRPHVPSHNTYYENQIDRYASRHNIKPGITGWAQLNGLRGETDTIEKMAKRVEYDIWYVENWSLALDFKILFLTPFVVLFQRKAY